LIIIINSNSKSSHFAAPRNSIRVSLSSGFTPTDPSETTMHYERVNDDIWDLVNTGTDWGIAFVSANENLLEVISINIVEPISSTYRMFDGCSSITRVPLFDTSAAVDMSAMFTSCTSLDEVPNYVTSSCEDFGAMFQTCYSLRHFPELDTSKGKNFEGMFTECSSIVGNIPNYNISSAENLYSMFWGCGNITGGMYSLYLQASSYSPIPAHEDMFSYAGTNTASGRAERAQIPTSWGGDLAE
jgi:hypothetical protein